MLNNGPDLPGPAQSVVDQARDVLGGPLQQAQDAIQTVERAVSDVLGTYRKATAFARRIADLAKPAKPATTTSGIVGTARHAFDLLTGIKGRGVEETVSQAAGLIVAVYDMATSEDGLKGLGLGDTALGSVIGTLETAYDGIINPPTDGDALDYSHGRRRDRRQGGGSRSVDHRSAQQLELC